MIYDELEDENAIWRKVVDTSLPPPPSTSQDLSGVKHSQAVGHAGPGELEKEDQRIIAFAKWCKPKDGVMPDTDLPVWPDGADTRLCDETFGAWAREHVVIMGDRGHWYLEILATDPKHQGRGAGSMLMRIGTQNADQDGKEAYLEASPEGVSLYKKFGFEEAAILDTNIRSTRVNEGQEVIYRNVFMLRPSKRGNP